VRRALITGPDGFVGRHLAQALNASGNFRVTSLARKFDLTSVESARQGFRSAGEVDIILHAADRGGDASWAATHAATQFNANMSMAVNVLAAWRDEQPQARFVGFSSLWAYPESVVEVKEESYWSGRMYQPTEQYGLSKKVLGVGIQSLRREFGMRGTVLVLGSVYGPGDRSSRVIPALIRRMRANPETLEVMSSATATRDFVYIDDQVAGIIQHLDHDGELLNVTSGQYNTIETLVTTLSRVLGFTGNVSYLEGAALGVPSRKVDVSLATAATGWPLGHLFTSLEAGLTKTVDSGVGLQ